MRGGELCEYISDKTEDRRVMQVADHGMYGWS